MRYGRIALACLLVAATTGQVGAPALGQSRVTKVRDVWFTTTVTVPHQRYSHEEPERIWTRVEEFVRGKDEKVIMIVVFNDHGSHSIAGTRVGPQGKETPFKWSVTTSTGATSGWRAASRSWEVGRLAPGTHTVELTVDSTPIGKYSFVVK